MNKSGREKLNLLFSSFLVIGFVVCIYFFMTLTTTVTLDKAKLIKATVFTLFGLILFYATRVGEGVAVKRFSPIILCVLDLPALYIILASLFDKLPLHSKLMTVPEIMMAACIAFGYGIMYTFYSGFELAPEVEETAEKIEVVEETTEEAEEVVEGGLLEELSSFEDEVASEDDVKDLESLDGADAE